MEIINGLEKISARHRGVAVTIGNFDGMHIGHQRIIARLKEKARELGAKTLAITFEPHPVKALFPERGLRTLTPPEEKLKLLKSLGVDYTLVINFTRDFSKTTADEFIEKVLVGKLGARAVVVGHSYSFGKGKQGSTVLLRRRGRKYSFSAHVVRSVRRNGEVVSSSRVRSLLGWGRVCEAAALLGRPYSISGTVVVGAGRGGKLLETPTANISTENEYVPRMGVYAVRVDAEGRRIDGVANIGMNPTFSGTHMSYEAHLFDYKGDLRGKNLRVFFIDRIREERTFASAGDLKDQIVRDIRKARAILRKKTHAACLDFSTPTAQQGQHQPKTSSR